jgi:tetratricopeptide (TPR) repeat protein
MTGMRWIATAALAAFVSLPLIGATPAASPATSADIERGEKALAAGDYDAAISAFEAALQADPDDMQAGSQYRQAWMRKSIKARPKEGNTADFDKEISWFEKLVAAKGSSAPNAYLNFGFSYVDKIPAAGSITQVILANTALTQFSKSIDLKPSWIALYTRGNSYLYWPKIFGRAQLGVNDLEKAYAMQKGQGKKSYYVRVYISLGDGYWKTDNLEKAKAIWKEGAAMFPESQGLKDRLAKDGDALKEYIDNVLDPNKRVDTDLRELWTQQ